MSSQLLDFPPKPRPASTRTLTRGYRGFPAHATILAFPPQVARTRHSGIEVLLDENTPAMHNADRPHSYPDYSLRPESSKAIWRLPRWIQSVSTGAKGDLTPGQDILRPYRTLKMVETSDPLKYGVSASSYGLTMEHSVSPDHRRLSIVPVKRSVD